MKYMKDESEIRNEKIYEKVTDEEEHELYQCPYESACKCSLTDCCLECETFGMFLNGKTIPINLANKTSQTTKDIKIKTLKYLLDEIRQISPEYIEEFILEQISIEENGI